MRRTRLSTLLLPLALFPWTWLAPGWAQDDSSGPAVKPAEIQAAASTAPPATVPVRPAAKPEIDAGELLGHIQFLASEELRGREAGTPDQLRAAQYVAEEFRRYGLEPCGDEKDGRRAYLQEFPLPEIKGAAPGTELTLRVDDKETAWTLKKDFAPFPAGMGRARAEGGVAFAGYGIRASEYDYDDFKALDLAGRWALILRYEPQEKDPRSKFDGLSMTVHSALAAKIKNCAERKAVGVLIVTGPAGREQEPETLSASSSPLLGEFTLPVFQLTRAAANQILAPSGATVKDLQAGIDKDLSCHSLALKEVKLSGVSLLEFDRHVTANVVARLEGRDEKQRRECVIVGAHCDHVGLGRAGSLLGDAGRGKIHPGADDNASGTAGLLEIAQCLAALKPEERPRRTVIFVAFSGEEKGLLGSAYYLRHPCVPLKDTIAMLNMDMLGRSEGGAVQISGLGTAKGFKELVLKHLAGSHLKAFLGTSGDGPSDHATFYHAHIPVLFFFTGIHPDYHRPSDTWDKINAPTAQEVAVLVRKVLGELAEAEERPKFLEASARGYLGIGLDQVAAAAATGYPVGTVAPRSPAAEAGLKPGDLIVVVNGQRLAHAMDLSMALLDLGPGDLVNLTFKRGAESISVETKLAERPESTKKKKP